MKKILTILLILSGFHANAMTVIRDTINVGSIYTGDSINITLPIENKTTRKVNIRKLYWTKSPNFSDVLTNSNLIPAYSKKKLKFVVTNSQGANRMFTKKLVVVTDEFVHRVVINGEFLAKKSITDKIILEAVKRKEHHYRPDTVAEIEKVDILNEEKSIEEPTKPDSFSSEFSKTDSVVIIATEYLGTPYVWGGCTPDGFDCSGYVRYVYQRVDHKLSRTSRSQATEGIMIPFSDAQPGDLIFFEGRRKNGVVGHVGIVVFVDNTSIAFIHSSTNRGVSLAETTNNYFNSRILGIRRVLN
jgi:cell wall-associated NlpC family hydrolase